jgi:hypothetical protein
VGLALVYLGSSTLGVNAVLVVSAALFVIAIVLLAAVGCIVDEVLQKQSERIRTLEQSLAAHHPEHA